MWPQLKAQENVREREKEVYDELIHMHVYDVWIELFLAAIGNIIRHNMYIQRVCHTSQVIAYNYFSPLQLKE